MNGQQTWELEPSAENIQQLQQIVKDLETVHDPRTSNAQRLDSQTVTFSIGVISIDMQRLDQIRDSPQSWRIAVALSSQINAFPDPVRHYGLSVLESEIKYHWRDYSAEESLAIRHGLLQLCGEVFFTLKTRG